MRHGERADPPDETERVAGVGSFDYRPQDGATTWSDNLYRIYGLDPALDQPLAADEFRERIHPDDHGALDAMMATMAGGGIYTADLRFRRFDGVERALHLRGESLLNADGQLERAHGTTQDVTETRAIEAELRESRRRVVEAMRVAGWAASRAGPTQVSSSGPRSCTSCSGWTRRPRSGRWGRSWTGWDATRSSSWLRAREIGPFEFEHQMARADGALRLYEVRGEAYEQDGAIWVRGTVRDVTAVRRGEAQQAAVATLTRQALEGVPLKHLLKLACEHAALALGAEAVGAVELQPDGSFTLAAAHGVPDEMVGGPAPEAAVVLAGEALEWNAPALVADWRTERPDHQPAQVGDLEVLSSIAVPIQTADRPFGALGAGTVASDRFGPDSADFLAAIANVLAAAIERTAHEEQIEVLAAERGRLVAQTLEAEERMRRRVSEAIHDGALQDLLAARQDLVEAQEDGDQARGLSAGGARASSAPWPGCARPSTTFTPWCCSTPGWRQPWPRRPTTPRTRRASPPRCAWLPRPPAPTTTWCCRSRASC